MVVNTMLLQLTDMECDNFVNIVITSELHYGTDPTKLKQLLRIDQNSMKISLRAHFMTNSSFMVRCFYTLACEIRANRVSRKQ